MHRHYRTLRRVLQVAVEKQKLPANPCDAVEPPRVPKREMAFSSWGEAVDLAEDHRDRYRPLILLAVDAGMRWSELVGLRRSKLDVRRRKVRVTELLVRLETGEWCRTQPKTAGSVRSITLSSVTAELLAEHLERFAGRGPDGLVFPNGAGYPLTAPSFWTNHFTPARTASVGAGSTTSGTPAWRWPSRRAPTPRRSPRRLLRRPRRGPAAQGPSGTGTETTMRARVIRELIDDIRALRAEHERRESPT